MSKLLFVALSFGLLALAVGDQPLSSYREFEEIEYEEVPATRNDERAYRLPTTVEPLDYDIYLDLFFGERADRPFSYDGSVDIVIQAKVENVRQIVLHANVDTIRDVKLKNLAGEEVNLNSQNPHETEALYHFLKVNVENPLTPNVNYTLHIEYSSTMNEGPMKRGIWRGWYTDENNVERIYATTHFQPYNARQAFPCWDEPLFKAVFKVHISRPSGYNGIFSNTRNTGYETLPNDRVRTDFAATPVMSSYLVTFLVSETFTVIAEDTSFNPPIRIIGRSNTVGLADHVLELAVKMTEYFSNYFGIPYEKLHPNLLNDHVSSPDWASAGTENWGMVSYRELYMIIDKNETIMSNEHYAATLVSHELAHKWFGNLITCYWWSNTWINEGYASYFGYMATHAMFPEYEFPDHFNSRYLQTSLAFDSSISTVPLNHEVNTPLQVTGHFGTISYSKAASFLRMTANIMTLETFQKSCKLFLLANFYKPTNQFDLLQAMNEAIVEDNSLANYPGFDFGEYYKIWVNEPGYPILTVDINYETGQMELKQERFFLNPDQKTTDQVYPIPITYTTSTNADFSNLRPSQMMTTASTTIEKPAGEEWVIFNIQQQGHYRVNYNHRNWELISDALLNQPDSIHYLNRAQIVDDVFALMRSERMTIEFALHILKFLAKETNHHVWDPAISGFNWLRARIRHLPEKQAEFDAHVLSLMEHAITTLGFEPKEGETPTVTMARQSILHFACLLGHEKCVQESWDRFYDWRVNGNSVNSRVRRNVYVTGMREGDGEDFNFLLAKFRASNYANDQLEMLRGMGATKDPELLTRYLQLTLSKEVRSHDKLNSFNYALLGNQENYKTVMQFVKDNINEIRTAYVEDSPARPVHSALSNLAGYMDESALEDYEAWLDTQSDLPQLATAKGSITSARNNISWGTANVDKILAAIRSSATKTVTSLFMLVAMTVLLQVV
ncbi:membrane alanyl aminopeptidase [Spodoptera frugiperda]|uniref:Aminopeptidase n=1 Tax=Spodoptera frugiperda TaxID=7108 RepID=A0A9R0EJI6_SPOFR|nr:membrane alanyl aminopeptidase [Spodoptera frugiperda]